MAWSAQQSDFYGASPSSFTSGKKKQWGTVNVAKNNPNYQNSNNRFYGQGGDFGNNYDTTSPFTKIANITPGQTNLNVVGAVIAKTEPRSFPSKKDPGTERYVLSFTLRDSPVDFLNVSCWGSREYIETQSNTFRIGDLIEIENAASQSKPQDGSDERFRPWTPSMCHLNLGENRSTIKQYDGYDVNNLNRLPNIPVKAHNDFYSIADIQLNGQNLDKELINILMAVKHVGQVKEFTTKQGREVHRLEVRLFDDTANSFSLNIWDQELIDLALTWAPRDFVIFGADVRLQYDEYRKTMVATATSKTIFTVNPDTKEAHSLYRYGQTANLPDDDSKELSFMDTSANVDVDSIQEVFTIHDVLTKQETVTAEGGTELGILYGIVTQLDIDGELRNVVAVRCSKCKYRVRHETGCCVNKNCPQGSCGELDADNTETVSSFDMRLSVSDSTGTITNCNLVGEAAEKFLGCSVEDFMSYSDQQRTQLKWGFLFERCKIHFKMLLASYERLKTNVKVLSCSKADLREAVHFMCR